MRLYLIINSANDLIISMRQPIKGKGGKARPKVKPKRRHAEYGTSKLEADFARDFLDRYGIKYIYQYKAEGLGRYYDFAVTADSEYPYKMTTKDGVRSVEQNGQYFDVEFIIEVDGDYYHSNPALIKESEMNPMQKHNRRVDEQKDRWCAMHCIPLLRIWESDIRKHPDKVLKELEKYIKIADKSRKKRLDRRRPH